MNDKQYLILRLEGLLQSWDDSSKWDDRGTDDFPTKSGIVGMLGCALGLPRGDQELVELNDAIRIGIRADRPGQRVEDFQTITGFPLYNAEGKPKSTGNTIVSRHTYLQDACFTVVVETNKLWHDRIVHSLENPKWAIYLGRKTCVPSRPVLECADTSYTSILDAIQNYPTVDRALSPMPFEIESNNDNLSSLTRADSLATTNREFVLRRVWRGSIQEVTNVPDKD